MRHIAELVRHYTAISTKVVKGKRVILLKQEITIDIRTDGQCLEVYEAVCS